MRIKCAEKTKSRDNTYVPHKLRSRPFRCISLPILCLALFIFYWFVLCPLVYYLVRVSYLHHHKKDWTDRWPYYYWSVAFLVFIAVLALLVCLWRCKRKEETNEEVRARQMEFDSLLTEAIEYNTLKANTTQRYSLNDVDCKTASKETIDDRNFSVINVQELEMGVKQSSLPTEIPLKERETKRRGVRDDPLIGDIDKLFPRCSVRQKKRPDTLILRSPTIIAKESETRRHTMKDDAHSPLTPREIFFFDLIHGANKRDSSTTLDFLENERKHSSNNFVGAGEKPEVKDFILKKKKNKKKKEKASDSGASSPEFFIANVTTPTSNRTAEAFLFVDGGAAETKFKITVVDDDDGGGVVKN